MEYLNAVRTLFNKCLNQTYPFTEEFTNAQKNVITADIFVFDAVLNMCKNTDLQSQVLKKLEYFTSFTKEYLANVHTKPARFNKIIRDLVIYINDETSYDPKESKNIETDNDYEPYAYIVNFEFDNKPDAFEPADIWANRIILKNDNTIVVGSAGSLYQYDNILCRSIVGKETVNKWGLDGFLALLIIFLHDDKLVKEPKSLRHQCILKVIDELNETLTIFAFSKKSITNYLNLFNSISKYNLFPNYLHLLNRGVQMFFFKLVDNSTNTLMTYYHTDYENIYNRYQLKNNKLFPFIKRFMEANSVRIWIGIFKDILELEEYEIKKICEFYCKYFILKNYFGTIDLDKISLPIKRKEWYTMVNGIKYVTSYNEYSIDGKSIEYTTVYYDKNFNVDKILASKAT